MKAECPHCKQKGINLFSKWWSGSTNPSHCSLCKKISYVSNKARYNSFPALISILFSSSGILATLFLGSFYYLLLLPTGYFASQVYLVFKIPMVKSTKKQIEQNKKSGNMLIFFVICAFVIYYIVTTIILNP